MNRIPRPVILQKSVHTQLILGADVHEAVLCPFCGERITGVWVDGLHYLKPVNTCIHFIDFIAGAQAKPAAFFKAVQS